MDNGTEFKNNLFSRVAEQLGVERKIIHLHTEHSQMEELRDFINFSKAA